MTKFYGLPGRKCPRCDSFFATEEDYRAHLRTHWKKVQSGNGEWLPADLDPQLAQILSVVGTMIRDGYRYSLVNGRVIFRTRVEATY